MTYKQAKIDELRKMDAEQFWMSDITFLGCNPSSSEFCHLLGIFPFLSDVLPEWLLI